MNTPNKSTELEDRLNDAIAAMTKNIRQGRRIVALKPMAKALIFTDRKEDEEDEEDEEDKTDP